MEKRKGPPNLGLYDFVERDFLENEYDMEVFVEPTTDVRYVKCPHCGSSVVTVHANDERFFRDVNMYEKRVGVSIEGKRYKCGDCKKTFVLEYESVDRNGKMSKRLREAIQRKALNQTFTSVAEEYGLAAKTVERTFGEYAEILDRRPDVKAPEVLGLDECHLQMQMRPVYVDIENATILEMGRSVKRADVIRDLMQFEDLDKVKVVTTDMCAGYRSAIQEVLPNAIHVVDKFHVVQAFLRTVDTAYKAIREEVEAGIKAIPDSDKRKEAERRLAELNLDAYMFRMTPENMHDWRYSRYVEIMDTYPKFAELAVARRAFFEIYQLTGVSGIASKIKDFRRSIPKSPAYNDMRKFLEDTMLKRWHGPIFNYFKVQGLRKTNATTERLNGAIKSMQNMGRGYSYSVLRAKMLFGGQTARRPLYRRISKEARDVAMPPEANYYTARNYSLFCTGKPFQPPDPALIVPVDPCVAGGVQEPGGYYGGRVRKIQAKPEFVQFSQRFGDYAIDGPLPMNGGLELVENGGAEIDKIIAYGSEHGECI